MWTPRDYQAEAIEAGLDALAEGSDSLIVVPTGGGKAGIICTIMRRMLDEFGPLRIVNATHVAELVQQNYEELIGMWEWAPAGVYSAGLNRREMHSQILFAGIQSVYNKAERLGRVDALFIDEAHLIPKKGNGQYLTFIRALREANPDMRLMGFTATDYRIDSGRLTEGEDALFQKVAYEVGIRRLIDDGYLSTLVTKATAAEMDVSGVGRTGGDFKQAELQAAVDKDDLTRAIVDEIVAYGKNRRSWLVFGSGVEHAHHLAEEIRRRGYSAETITGETPAAERKRIIEDFKAQRIRALTNASVLTTGFNAPGVDLLAMARPTESTSLYVQICGRGTRTIYAPGHDLSTREGRLAAIAAGPKPNALVLDFAGNIKRHGPIDMVKPRKPGSGKGDAPVKTCPKCFSVVHASVMECPDCGHQWEHKVSEKITRTAAAAPILSKSEPVWVKVSQRTFRRHEKFGSPPSVRVDYLCGMTIHKEWVAVENPKAGGLVRSWWKSCGGAEPIPRSVDEMLERVGELRPIDEIRIEADGKYWRVTGRRNGGSAEDVVEAAPKREHYCLESEIPF